MQGAPAAIGRYQILSELGRGGMGVVYLAQDPTLKRKVAIKCMLERKENDSAMARFQREAETSSRLNHPNVITVYDVGEDEQAGPFLAMEYVEGSSLSTLITQESLSPEVSYQVLTQAMLALQAAHRAGIIHRDVKPDNLLVGRDGRVKLMDFGIALGEGARLTAVGDVLGSPSYTAPELLQGTDANPLTDLYAFVVMAFEVVTGGTLPFQGNSLGATMYQIVHEPPTMPQGLDSHLVSVFKRGMHKDPDQRFPDFTAFMTALAEGLQLPTPLAQPASPILTPSLPSGIGKTRSTQDDLKTSAVPARRSQAPIPSQDPAGETGRSPAATPEALLRHKGSGDLPKAAAPPVRPHPQPVAMPIPTNQNNLPGRLIAAVALIAVGLAGAWGWNLVSASRTRSIKFETDPPFTHVVVDGTDLGTTPISLSLPPSARTVQFTQVGYEPLTVELTEQTQGVSTSLKLKAGYFRVITEPRDANVYLNGEFLDTAPIWSREYREKSSVIRVEKPGFETREIAFSPDKPLPEPIVLKRKK